MPKQARDYFRYFPVSPDIRRWGIGVTACGFTHIPAGSPYPPGQHPADHDFDWNHGRVLDSVQIVLIAGGAGQFETREAGLQKVAEGSAFILLPGVWHRYRPDPKTGWDESWVELRGPILDQQAGPPEWTEDTTVRDRALAAGLDEALEAIHVRARASEPGFDPELSALGLRVLAVWCRAGRAGLGQSRLRRAASAAEHYFAAHHTEPVNVRALARSLGVAYSHFRREFKVQTGYSPWQYVLHLRLARARRLLASSDAKLDDIAERLGFNSAYHLSAVFKQAYGLAPQHWRRQLCAPAPAAQGSRRRAGRKGAKT